VKILTKKTILVGGAIILAVVVLLAIINLKCGRHATHIEETPATIKIGAVLPLTGRLSYIGQGLLAGLQAAMEEINSKTTYIKFELIVEDTKSDLTETITATNKLIDVDKVDAIFVFGNQYSNAIAPITSEREVLQISYTIDPKVAETSPYTFVIFPTYPQEEDLMKRYLNKSRVSRVAFLYSELPSHQKVVDDIVLWL